MSNAGNDSLIKTSRTVFAVLETLQERNGARVTEVAGDLGIAKSTAHRHLNTLVRHEFVAREGDEYVIGFRFIEFGECAKSRKPEYVLAKSKVKELAETTGERVQFIVEEHDKAVFIHREVGTKSSQTNLGVGKRVPIHATAAGKAIMAHLPSHRIEEITEGGLPRLTDETITDIDELKDELQTIRDRGYSFNRQENLDGLDAVGVPVKGPNGRIIGAISVSGPTKRLSGDRLEEELPNLLMGVANELELNFANI